VVKLPVVNENVLLTGGLREVRRAHSSEVSWHGAASWTNSVPAEWRGTQRLHRSVHDFTAGADTLPFQMCRRNQPGLRMLCYSHTPK